MSAVCKTLISYTLEEEAVNYVILANLALTIWVSNCDFDINELNNELIVQP